MTTVVNMHYSECDVRIDRGTAWGNPYRLPPLATMEQRQRVIERYRQHLLGRPDLLARLSGLCGKRLGCWCAPLPCHGDVLVELIAAASAS